MARKVCWRGGGGEGGFFATSNLIHFALIFFEHHLFSFESDISWSFGSLLPYLSISIHFELNQVHPDGCIWHLYTGILIGKLRLVFTCFPYGMEV